jgi:hypothetical protein
VVAVAQENAVSTKSGYKCLEKDVSVAFAVELSGTSFDDHIEWPKANGGVQNIAHHELSASAGTPRSWFTVVFERLRRELKPLGEVDCLGRSVHSYDFKPSLSEGARLLGEPVASAEDGLHFFRVHCSNEIPVVAEHVD